ncbi:hypothetical protein ACS0TY_006381 [Phlomoides rotata]
MRGYGQDEYEDWDEYEEDGDEQEEEEGGENEHEETHQPTQEELDYLALRQKIKETIRKQKKKDLGTANSGSHDRMNTYRKDNYGSFFGPSQPVIAQRVIQESKSLLENPELAARIAKKANKTTVSAPPARLKSQVNHRPAAASGLKKKVEMLKNTRDYSFLLSDDAEVPASLKSPPLRNVSTPKPDARSAQLQQRSRPAGNDRGREDRGREPPSNGRDGRKPILASSHGKPKVGLEKLAHTGKSSADSRRMLGSSNGSGPGRPLGPKGVPSKSSIPATGKMSQPIARNVISGDRRPSSSSVQSGARKPNPSNIQSAVRRPPPSHGQQQPTHLKRPLAQREYQETSKPKVIAKQALPSSRPTLKRSPPRAPHRAPLRDERPKAKPKRPLHGEDSDDAINMIRQMFG